MLHGTIRNDDSVAQHRPMVATLWRHCFEFLQHCSNIATLLRIVPCNVTLKQRIARMVMVE